MRDHIRIVAILHIILGSLTVLGALAVLALFGGIATLIGASGSHDSWPAIPIVGAIGGFICVILIIIGVPGLVAGIGMLKFRPWARVLGIVVSALDLIHVPLGTALGVYGLWALLSAEGERLFRESPYEPAGV